MTTGASATDRPANGRPRLLVLTPDFPPMHGGVQLLAHRLALAMEGFDVEVVTLDGEGARRFDAEGELVTRRVGAHLPAGSARALALNAGAVRRALRFRPQVTLSVHAVASPAALAIRRVLRGRTAQYFHAIEMLGKPRLCAFAAERADLVIAVSSYTASLVAAAGAEPADLRVIPPGVDLPSDRSALPVERPTVLTVAQLLYRYKGHDVLIRALTGVRARVPDVQWVVIGEGPLRPSLESLVDSCGLTGVVRFLGAVSDEERNSWLRRANVFAMPSRLPGEGFGIAYLEASAFGKPVVAGKVAGPLDAVADGVSGILVDPIDPDAVGDAVTRLLLDRELAERLGRGGLARAREYAWPLVGRRVEAALLELVGSDS